jgi:hypothetical protein
MDFNDLGLKMFLIDHPLRRKVKFFKNLKMTAQNGGWKPNKN